MLSLNEKLSAVQLLRLRATFHALPYYICERTFYARTQVKNTRRWKSTLSNVCEAAPIFLFCAPNGLNKLRDVRFEFSFVLIGKSTVAFLTGQSWCVLKSWYTDGGPEQGVWRCFADGLHQSLVSSVAQCYPS